MGHSSCGRHWRSLTIVGYFGAWRREGQEFSWFLVLSGGADGVRASEAHHAVERLDGDLGFDLLGRPGLGAQGVADHTLVSAHRRLRYAADGTLEIDNLTAERALRGITVGRKNW